MDFFMSLVMGLVKGYVKKTGSFYLFFPAVPHLAPLAATKWLTRSGHM
jgi:hypothetical protein